MTCGLRQTGEDRILPPILTLILVDVVMNVPNQFVELAKQWHGGQNTQLYAIASSGEFYPSVYNANRLVDSLRDIVMNYQTSNDAWFGPSEIEELSDFLLWATAIRDCVTWLVDNKSE